jgi:hypothetical protein
MKWLKKLKFWNRTCPRPEGYWEWLEEWGKEGSDGCTHALEIHVKCCYEHDFAYRFGIDPIAHFNWKTKQMTIKEVDARFRRCNQCESPLKKLSPMSWWRWAAVRIGGRSEVLD